MDILEGGATYTSFGFEPFTPNNELRYKTFQLQDNFTQVRGKHALTFGATCERYESENVFFSGRPEHLRLQLAGRLLRRRERLPGEPEPDDVAGHAAPLPGALDQHPGLEKPLQPLEVWYYAAPTPRTSGGRPTT